MVSREESVPGGNESTGVTKLVANPNQVNEAAQRVSSCARAGIE